MHKPGGEKRMVVILGPAEYDRWLQCTLAEAVTFFKQWLGPLADVPAALPPRGKLAPAPKPPPPVDPQGDLLAARDVANPAGHYGQDSIYPGSRLRLHLQ